MKKLQLSIAAVALALSALPAVAQQSADRGWYIGGSIGHAKVSDACSAVPAGVTCDDKSVSWGVLGGYKFSRNFAGEFGWGRIATIGLSGLGTDDVKANAYEASVLGGAPVGPVELFGRLGMYHARLSSGGTANLGGSDNGAILGAGVQYNFAPRWGVRGEWKHYHDVKDSNINQLNASILFKF